ncbi:MAG TPA: hypothetical protein VEQ85_12575 [Lacipirellulaceae bacterium]|nr:hypothetical protein [Lacipirellulaceae bacterium]
MGYQKLVGVALVLGCVVAARTVGQDSSPDQGEQRGADSPRVADDPFAASPEDGNSPETDAALHGIPIHSETAIAGERRIESVLDQPLKMPLDFVDTPLNLIMETLAEAYEIPIVFDVQALESVAQSPETEVTIAARNISLRSALDLALSSCQDLTYIIDREVLLITTDDEASTRLQTRVYAIADLLPRRANSEGGRGAPESGFTPIVGVVTRSIDNESWALNGSGEGEICVVEPGMMVVTQSQRVHTQIDRLLATLRHVRDSLPAEPVVNSAESSRRGGFF